MSWIVGGLQDGLTTVRRFDGARGGIYKQPNEIDQGLERYKDEEIVFS